MLSFYITGVAELKKALGPAVKLLSTMVNDYGFVRVKFVPTVDAVIASALIGRVLTEHGTDVALNLGVHAPTEVTEPCVFVGLPPSKLSAERVKAPALFVLNERSRHTPLPGTVVLGAESSLSTVVVRLIEEGWVVEDLSRLLSIASALLAGRDRGEAGSLIGLDGELADELAERGVVKEAVTLRFFDIDEKPICESIPSTVSPFIPGLTGSPDKCMDLLRSLGVQAPSSALLSDIDKSQLERLVREIYGLLLKASRRQRRPTEVIGKVYISHRYSALRDLRKVGHTLSILAELAGIPELMASVWDGTVAGFIDVLYRNLAPAIIDCINEAYDAGVGFDEIPQVGRVAVLECENLRAPGPPFGLSIIGNELRRLGIIEDGTPVTVKTRGVYLSTLGEVISCLGRERTERLLSSQYVEYTPRGVIKFHG